MSVDPVMIQPERGRALLQDAAARDGCGLGPGVNLLQRKILKDYLHLRWELGGHVVAQRFRFLFTVGAFEVAKFDHRDWRVLRAEAGSAGSLQLIEIFLKRILREVVDHAANDVLAVLGDIERLVLRAALVAEVNVYLKQFGRGARLGIVDGNLHLWNNREQMPNVDFKLAFIQRRLRFHLRGKRG